MFCHNCGERLEPGSVFCGACGAAVPEAVTPEESREGVCPRCGAVLEAGGLFCPQCGAAAPESPEQTPPPPEQEPPRFCARCGAVLEPGSVFCAGCGAPADGEAAAGGQPPILFEAPPAAGGARMQKGSAILGRRRGGGKLGVAAVAVAAVLVVGALAAVVVPAIVRNVNPQAYLAGCAAKTFAELSGASAKAADSLGVAGVLKTASGARVEQNMTLKLESMPDSAGSGYLDFLNSSVTMMAQTDLKNRTIAAEYGVSLGDLDLGSVRLFARDNILALGSPELVGSAFYGVNTETLGADFDRNPVLEGAVDPDLSFNLFESLERWQKGKLVLSDETLARIAALSGDLSKETGVEKDGKQSVEINGSTEKLPQYTLTIPASAARTWIRGAFRAVTRDENVRQFLELLFAGQEDQLDFMLDYYTQSLDNSLDYLEGDVTLILSIRKGHVARAVLELEVNGADMELEVQVGTAKNVLDAFSAELRAGSGSSDVRMSWTSEGNHSGKDGAYSDQTRVTVSEDGETVFSISASTELDTRSKSDNFSFSMKITPDYGSDVALKASGTVEVDKRAKRLSADFDRLSLSAEGESLSLSGAYSIEPCKDFDFDPEDVKMIADMDEFELGELIYEIDESARDIVYALMPY